MEQSKQIGPAETLCLLEASYQAMQTSVALHRLANSRKQTPASSFKSEILVWKEFIKEGHMLCQKITHDKTWLDLADRSKSEVCDLPGTMQILLRLLYQLQLDSISVADLVAAEEFMSQLGKALYRENFG